MITCNTCKHFREVTLLNDIQCHHEKNLGMATLDYVTGGMAKPRPQFYMAQSCRLDNTACSPDARWFEQKESA